MAAVFGLAWTTMTVTRSRFTGHLALLRVPCIKGNRKGRGSEVGLHRDVLDKPRRREGRFT